MNFVIYYYFFSLYVFNAVQPNRVFFRNKSKQFFTDTFCSYNIFEKVIFVKRTLNIFET